ADISSRSTNSFEIREKGTGAPIGSPQGELDAWVHPECVVRAPFEIAEIFVDSDSGERPPRRFAEIRHDHGRVPDHRYHRMPLIDPALPHVRARVRVNVRKEGKVGVLAALPEGGVSAGVKGDSPALVSGGVNVVIANILADALIGLIAQKERAAFALPH